MNEINFFCPRTVQMEVPLFMEVVGAFLVQPLWGARLVLWNIQNVGSVLRIIFKTNLTNNALLNHVLVPFKRGSWVKTLVRLVEMDSFTIVPLFGQRMNLRPSFTIAVLLVKLELFIPRHFMPQQWINVFIVHLASAVRLVAQRARTATKTTF
jgi:hypothetical protein